MFLPFSQRGKDWEPKALALRRLASIGSDGLLDPWALAPEVGLLVVDAADGLLESLDAGHRAHLLDNAGNKWSGGVLPIALPNGMRICILNPTHSHARNKITLMEEIAHVHLAHRPSQLVFNEDKLQVRDFNDAQEAEAYGVGAAALLPWHSFFHCVNEGNTYREIAELYEVTEQLARYRVNITGADRLYKARQRALSGRH